MVALPEIGEGGATAVDRRGPDGLGSRTTSSSEALLVQRRRGRGPASRLATGTVWQPVCQSRAEMPACSCIVLRDFAREPGQAVA